MAHMTGMERDQLNLWPPWVDDRVTADALVRVADAFADGLANRQRLARRSGPHTAGEGAPSAEGWPSGSARSRPPPPRASRRGRGRPRRCRRQVTLGQPRDLLLAEALDHAEPSRSRGVRWRVGRREPEGEWQPSPAVGSCSCETGLAALLPMVAWEHGAGGQPHLPLAAVALGQPADLERAEATMAAPRPPMPSRAPFRPKTRGNSSFAQDA